ncbi:beta-sandwich domain-containing protein [Bdellovibrio bacteriovorus]|nr:beta-sandwich domain-containing protein [Bdellovibrio bacteriovorus]
MTRKTQGLVYRLEVQPATSIRKISIKAVKSKLLTHKAYLITSEGKRIKILEFSKSSLLQNQQTAMSEDLNSRERISAIDIRAESMQSEADIEVTAYSDESRPALKVVRPAETSKPTPPPPPSQGHNNGRPDRYADVLSCRWNGSNNQPYNESRRFFIGKAARGFTYAENCDDNIRQARRAGGQLVCNWSGTNYVAYRTSDGVQVGRTDHGYSELEGCQKAIEDTANGLMCSWNGTGYSAYVISEGSRNVGKTGYGNSSYDVCAKNIKTATRGILCQWNGNNSQPYVIATNQGIGKTDYGYSQLSSCQQSLGTASRGFICNWTGEGYGRYSVRNPTEITSGVYKNIENCMNY